MDFLKYHPAGALGAMLAQEKAAEQDVVVTGNLINQ
jgi:hypothetical protein